MSKTKPKPEETFTRTDLEAMLEPVIVAELEKNGVSYTSDHCRRLLRAVTAIAARHLFHSGGTFEAAAGQCAHGLRIAQVEAAAAQDFSVFITQAPAKA